MFKKILPLLLFASPLAAQVQYEIIDVPVCWNDSSLIKYVYVTTSGAYADLGYYNAEGLPVTVTGATPTPGFCADALTIDSTAGRSFTITLGDQTVTWVDSVGSGTGGSGIALTDLSVTKNAAGTANLEYNNTNGVFTYTPPDLSGYLTDEVDGSTTNEIQDLSLTGNTLSLSGDTSTVDLSQYLDGVDKLIDLSDVDTANLADQYILKYNSSTQEWEVKENNIDGLTDGKKDANLNLWLGFLPLSENQSGQWNTATNAALYNLTTGSFNTGNGYTALGNTTSGNNNTATGYSALFRNKIGSGNTATGANSNNIDTLGSNNTTNGYYAASSFLYGLTQDSIGYLQFDSIVVVGAQSKTLNRISTNEIVLGAFTIGNGSNTATLGNNNITATYLKGTTNLRGYGLGNKEATDLSKTGSAYLAAFATDGTLIELDTTGLFGGSTGATTLGDLTDVTLTSPQINDILKYDGTKWINDTLSVSSGGVLSVTANNGLTNSGTATQPVIELGGTLTKNTTVSGDAKSIYFNNNLFYYIDTVFSFLVRPSVNEVANTFNIGAAANSWRSINTTDGIGNVVQIQANNTDDGVFLSSYLTATTTTFTKLELLPEEVQLITPDVNAGSATAGQVLTLVDAATGEVEFSSPATGIGLTDLSVTVATAGTANLSYNNTNGVFTYTPPDLSGYLTSEVDGSTTNELQNLSLAGTTLSISDGNSVDLSGFLRDTLTGTQTIIGNTNDYIFNGINDYQINLTGDKAFYVGHSKMYIRFDATEMKLYSSDTPINIEGAAGVNLEFAGGDYKFDNTAMQLEAYGSGNKEAGDLSKTPSDYKAAFATDGTLIEVSNIDAMVIACSDETTDITTGTAKVTFRAPHAMTIVGVRASLTTASTSGAPTIDINEAGTSILGTKLSIDANEKTSTTAATAATITDTAIADDAEITIDIDAAGTGATGLKVTILYRKN